MFGTLTAALLALLTISDQGMVFQPALSPDGALVAYAGQTGDEVAMFVASTSGGAAKRVATFGRGTVGRRLAVQTLSQGPWSPDGTTLLVLTAKSEGGPGEPPVALLTMFADGSDVKTVPEAAGTVDAACWYAKADTAEVIFAVRDTPESPTTRVLVVNPEAASDDPRRVRQVSAYDRAHPTRVLELCSSPDGRWVAILLLNGPRELRVRSVEVVDVVGETAAGTDVRVVPVEGSPNFLRFAGADTLFYVDSAHRVLGAWNPARKSFDAERLATDVTSAVPVLGGAFALVRTPKGGLESIEFATGERRPIDKDHTAVSSAGGKVALVRTSAKGAAIVVADIDAERLRAGKLIDEDR